MNGNPLHTLPDEHARATTIATSTRGWFDILHPDPRLVSLTDITTALSRLRRWTGQTPADRQPPTVLAHSLHVHQISQSLTYDPAVHALALLHDAHEAYIGDVSSPVKAAMRAVWRSYTLHPAASGDLAGVADPFDAIDHQVHQAVIRHFSSPDLDLERHWDDPAIRRTVEHADTLALAYETDHLFGPGTAVAWGLPRPRLAPPHTTNPLTTAMRFSGLVRSLTGIDD